MLLYDHINTTCGIHCKGLAADKRMRADSTNPTRCAFSLPKSLSPGADLYPWKQAPVTYELAKTDKVQFHFMNGPVEAKAAIGVAEHYEGPYYRFLDSDAPHPTQIAGVAKSLSRQATTAEDYGRGFREKGMTDAESSRACDFLQQYVEQHDGDPFDGILGFSEGASVAASLILRQCAEKRTSPFKFAIFICAIPPFRSDGNGIMLADETGERINIPTAHIVGSRDPGYQGSRVLYNLCRHSCASIFDHCGAHTIPWDLTSTQGIAKEILSIMKSSSSVPPHL